MDFDGLVALMVDHDCKLVAAESRKSGKCINMHSLHQSHHIQWEYL